MRPRSSKHTVKNPSNTTFSPIQQPPKTFPSRAPRGETKSSRPGGETKTMDMAAMAEAKARDSPLQQPPKPQAAPSVLTSVQEAVRRVRMGGDGADFLVVEWRQGAGTLGSQQQEQLEIKEVFFFRKYMQTGAGSRENDEEGEKQMKVFSFPSRGIPFLGICRMGRRPARLLF